MSRNRFEAELVEGNDPIREAGWPPRPTPGLWACGAALVKKEPKLPGVIPTVNVFSGLNCDLPPFAYLFVYLDCATER